MLEKLFGEKTEDASGANTESTAKGPKPRGRKGETEDKLKAGSLGFEESYSRLQSIIQALEREDTPLEDVVRKFEEGVKLIRDCSEFLKSAKLRIEKYIEEKDGTYTIKGLNNDQ